MSELNNKPTEGAVGFDATKFVPKEDFEKASSSLKELEGKLDEAKMSLLDPEYISFLESKKAAKIERTIAKATRQVSDADIAKMSSAQILDLAVDRAKEAVRAELVPQYEEQLKRTNQTLSDVLAVLELQEVEKKYEDFNTYRDQTRKVLETSTTPLTIEQAYKLAKSENFDPKAMPLTSSEKPIGSAPSDAMQTRVFKTKHDAADDAWSRIVGPGKDTI